MDQEEIRIDDPTERDADHQPSPESQRKGYPRSNYANARDVISPEILSALQREFAGLLWVPKVIRDAEQRAQDIIKLKAKGLCIARIAQLVHLSPRRVRQIVAKAQKEGNLEKVWWH